MKQDSKKKIFFSLGSNISDRKKNLILASEMLNNRIGKIELESKIYETEPWGFESTNLFLNQVICLRTGKSAEDVMKLALSIENDMGRTRNNEKYSSRIIDIDVLFFGHEIIKSNNIEVPHPRLHQRKFILFPLKEIAPDFVHPVLGKTICEILDECGDKLDVNIFTK